VKQKNLLLFISLVYSENRIGPNPKCVPCGNPSEKKIKMKVMSGENN
jgi:hypothetical protein